MLDVQQTTAITQTTDEDTATGTVFQKFLGHYMVDIGGRQVTCSISSKLRKQLIYPLAAPSSLHHRVKAVE